MHQAQLQTCGLGTCISSFFNALDRWRPGEAHASAGSKQMSVWEAVRRTHSEVGTILSLDPSHVQHPHPAGHGRSVQRGHGSTRLGLPQHDCILDVFQGVHGLLSLRVCPVQDPHPKLLVMGAALMCSGAMGLPVSGFPNMNAIALEDQTGKPYLATVDFLKVGIPCSVATYALVISVGYVIMRFFVGW